MGRARARWLARERYRAAKARKPDVPMQADIVAIVAIVAIATLGRAWQILFAYRQGVRRLRALRRRRAEIELFDRLERCMQSDRVE